MSYSWPSRHTRKLVLAALLALAITLLAPSHVRAQERTYHFPEVRIQAEVHPDGSMSVIERRTFAFQGRFRGAFQYIYLKGKTSIKNVQVGEEGRPYKQMPVGTRDIPGVFYVEQRPGSVYIDWSFEAQNQKRTFIISYLVENAVLVHRDVAELYWQFIGAEWEQPTDNASAALTLPAGANKDDIRAWGHGPLNGRVDIESPTRIVWSVQNLPPRQFLEGRVVCPVKLVPKSTNFSGREGLPAILNEEQALASRANLRRQLSRLDYILAPLLILFAAGFYLILRRRSITHPSAFQGLYYRDLPGDYSPAEAGYLFRLGRTKPEDFTATILDLARRGHLTIEEYHGESGVVWKHEFTGYRLTPKQGKDSLMRHEQMLYDFIFKDVARTGLQGQQEGVTFKDIERYAKSKPERVQRFYQSWRKEIKSRAESHGFFSGIAWSGVIAGAILIVIGLILTFAVQMYVSGITALVVGPLLIFGGAYQKKLSPIGADHYAKWKAFRRFLLDFSQMERYEIPALVLWDHYLVYAVVLGVAKQVIKQLQLIYPEIKQNPRLLSPAWYVAAARQPEQFDSFISSMGRSFQTAFRSAPSSGAGRGGGFSGGGGGGGGGGAR